jgi:hypothetical protein
MISQALRNMTLQVHGLSVNTKPRDVCSNLGALNARDYLRTINLLTVNNYCPRNLKLWSVAGSDVVTHVHICVQH